jgi:hypothetical protein
MIWTAARQPHEEMRLECDQLAAEYAVWIPDTASHALVYLNDEERHGVPFPHGIDDTIRQAIRLAQPEESP